MGNIDFLIKDFSNKNLSDFFFNKLHSFKTVNDVFGGYQLIHDTNGEFEDPVKIGEIELDNSDELLVFTCKVNKDLAQRSSKKLQFDIAKKVLQDDFKDGAIFVFYDARGNFRFSFIRKYYGSDVKLSNWKRYTYYVQPDKQNKTFRNQLGKCDFSSLDEIEKAFNVESLSKEFYTKLSHWYFASLDEVEFPIVEGKTQHESNSQAMIRLITRVIFAWFMKQKNLIPNKIFDKDYIDTILNYSDITGSTYYKAILQNLFFATLNTEMGEKRKWIPSQGYGIQHYYRYKRFFNEQKVDEFLELMRDIPFLNGGLFENLDIVETADKESGFDKKDIRIDCFSDTKSKESMLKVPDYLFFGERKANISTYLVDKRKTDIPIEGLIDLLNRYDFTIDENSHDDLEVALDPELLGTVFENLLASYNPETQISARKESGSFYTPRPIVDYMVKESLFYYLKDKSGLSEESIRLLISSDDASSLSATDKSILVEHITHIKILDPACGSGAYPMGALQQIVRLLNLLDPENDIYKEKLQEKLKLELQRTIDHSSFNELKDNIEEVFENQLNDPDYARKLFIIQNCLYGVDIQPIAMQITKLRFFISLLVEQQTDKNQENYGIKPLPNLETKFVAANTLIKLNKQDGFLKNPSIQDLEDELEQTRKDYFNARRYEHKKKCRIKENEIRGKIAELLKYDGWGKDTAKDILEWEPFNHNRSSKWFDPEWMFGVKSFDVVIGNPPYFSLSTDSNVIDGSTNVRKKHNTIYKSQNYNVFENSGDIYTLFYERGLDLAKKGGIMAYITSNKWMRTKYGKSLRKYFSNKEPLLLIDLGDGVFESALVDTNILIVRNRKLNKQNLKAIAIKDKRQIEFISESEMVYMDELSEESWVILNPIEKSIKDKIERIGTPLKDWDINIYRGILTGYNEAFIIDGAKRKDLIEEDPKSDEIIRPILRGRDIKRYSYDFADLYLITTFPSLKIDIEKYPAVKAHLLSFGYDRLKQTGDVGSRKKTNNKWFETQDSISYWEDFFRPKIIYPNMTKFLPFVYDENNLLTNQKCFIITGDNIEFLTAWLNSSLFKYSFKDNFPELQGGTRELSKVFFEDIPVIKVTSDTNIIFRDLIGVIQQSKNKGITTKKNEEKIDTIIFDLYDLTDEERDEIGFIEIQ